MMAWFVLVILVLLGVLGIASILLFRRHRTVAILLGAPVIVLLALAFLVFIGYPSQRATPTPYTVSYNRSLTVQVASESSAPLPSSSWSSGVDEFLLADIYPSAAAAAEAAARQVLTELPQQGQGRQRPHLTVTCGDSAIAKRVIEAFKESDRFDEVAFNAKGASAGESEAHVQVQSANVSVEVRGEALSGLAVVPYIDKPWVDRFSEYANRKRSSQFRVVSDKPYSTEIEARDRAIELAAAHLVDPVCRQLQHSRYRLKIGRDQMQSQIAAQLTGNLGSRYPVVADKFVQQFRRPFGDVWQVWILVDRVPAINQMASFYNRRSSAIYEDPAADRTALKTKIVSVVGVVVVILAAYLFLNAATRGYYVWALRVAAVVLALVGAAMIA